MTRILKVSESMRPEQLDRLNRQLQDTNELIIIVQTDAKMEFVEMHPLLKKYIKHVGDCAEVNFISDCSLGDGLGGGFTKDEIDILKAIENEIELERK